MRVIKHPLPLYVLAFVVRIMSLEACRYFAASTGKEGLIAFDPYSCVYHDKLLCCVSSVMKGALLLYWARA